MTMDEYRKAFRDGALAISSRVAALLVMRGNIAEAQFVLGVEVPEAKPPGRVVVEALHD